MRLRVTVAALVALFAVGCSDGPSGPGAPSVITELPRQLSAVEREVLRASNAFGFELAKEILPEAADENLFFSPVSASMLLGMILNGADGGTYDEMRRTLAFEGLSQEEINQGYRDLIGLLTALDPAVTVDIGNSVWAAERFTVRPDFLDRVRSHFSAEAAAVDFGQASTLTRINRWASDATRGKVETIFDELPGNTVMVLLNALYYEADWTTPFERARTEMAPFTRADGSTVSVDLMLLESELPVSYRDGVTLVELPYGGQAFSMVVAVPEPGRTVEALVRDLDLATWSTWTDGLAKSKAIVRLPRFELEWESILNDPLIALGMPSAFDPGAADFSRLTPGGGVWLALVKQKAFVSVDEEGTVAAAVTGGVMTDSAPLEIRADRPFLFAIRERLTGTVMFMGVVNDPS